LGLPFYVGHVGHVGKKIKKGWEKAAGLGGGKQKVLCDILQECLVSNISTAQKNMGLLS